MPQIQYAFRDDAKTVAMLTQGSTAACPLCQIVTVRKREIAPDFLDQYMVMDIKGTNFPASALTEYGRTLTQHANHRRFVAVIDSQIEFIVKSRTMHKLTEFLPAYTGTALYNFFEGQPYGYLIVLRVYSVSEEIPDALMTKGRMGSAQVISLYDLYGEKTQYNLLEKPQAIIEEGTFDYIKYEILHALRVENALIGVYGTDEESKRLLRQKREDYNDSTGTYKHTFNEDDDVDRAQVDYEETYTRVLSLAPTLTTFINYVREIKPPQMVEWQTLLPKAVNGDVRAKNRIVEMYLRNVIRIALYYAEKHGIPIEDAIQNGIVGLMTAVEKFDDSTNDTFQQYYPLWVRQVIQREMPTHLYARYFPVHIHEKLLIIREIATRYGLSLPEDYYLVDDKLIASISEELEVSTDKAKNYLRHLIPEISLEAYMETLEDNGANIDPVLIVDDEDLTNWTNQRMSQKALDSVLHTLTPREEYTIRLRFGFIDGRPRTLEEVGREFDITRERVRQIEAKALRKLHHPSRSRLLKGYL